MFLRLAEIPRGWRFFLAVLCAVVIVSISWRIVQQRHEQAATLAKYSAGKDPASTNGHGESKTTSSARSSQFLAKARFVGSDACVNCHSEECQSLALTGHGQSLNEVELLVAPPGGEFEHKASGRHYRVYRQRNELRHREFLRVDGDEIVLADYPMRYAIGSEKNRSYLVQVGEYLVQSPVSWYASLGRWDLSPGYDLNNAGFGRPIQYECLFCHSGRVDSVDGGRTKLQVQSLHIDCERCHGPGSMHVEARASPEWEGVSADPTIVNPGRLSRNKNESVCAECHLHSDAVVDRQGMRLSDFSPGLSIQDLRIHYSLQGPEKALTVTGHVEQLHVSQCYQQTESLTCITCHNPHSSLSVEERLAYYRQKCLTCHDETSCGMDLHQRRAQSAEDACVSCHMPKRASDIPHRAATDHRIGIHAAARAGHLSEVGDLVPLEDISNLEQIQQDRYLGLAYLNLSMKDSHPSTSGIYRQRAQDLLERVYVQGASDEELLVGLAQTYQRRNPQRSIELAQRAVQSNHTPPHLRVRGLYAISDSHIAQRETNLAIPALEQLVSLRRQAGDWYLLSVCRLRAGDLTGALDAAKQAVEIRPDLPNHHALLAEIYRQTHQPELAREQDRFERWLKEAVQIPKNAPTATAPATHSPPK